MIVPAIGHWAEEAPWTYGSLIAAINFDLSGATRIGKYVMNHPFTIPGVIATSVAVVTGLANAGIMFQLR